MVVLQQLDDEGCRLDLTPNCALPARHLETLAQLQGDDQRRQRDQPDEAAPPDGASVPPRDTTGRGTLIPYLRNLRQNDEELKALL
jgi:hypothetical protein